MEEFQRNLGEFDNQFATDQGVTLEHLDSYMDEFTFRFNRRRSGNRGKLFYRFA